MILYPHGLLHDCQENSTSHLALELSYSTGREYTPYTLILA